MYFMDFRAFLGFTLRSDNRTSAAYVPPFAHISPSIAFPPPAISSTANRAASTPATGKRIVSPPAPGSGMRSGRSPAWRSAPAWSHQMCSGFAHKPWAAPHQCGRTVREPVSADEHDRDHGYREAPACGRHAREQPVHGGVVREVRHELVDDAVRSDGSRDQLERCIAGVPGRHSSAGSKRLIRMMNT
jgi:predicted nucleic acid-binding Zn ribbon protein